MLMGGLRQAAHEDLRGFLETDYGNIVFGLLFPAVGAVILTRVPGHRLGWLYCVCGSACALSLASYTYAQRGLVELPGSLPGALAAGWVSSWIWICGFSPLITFGLLYFPDGRLPSRRWRPVAVLAGGVIVTGVVYAALRPGPLENHPVRDNPLGISAMGPWEEAVTTFWLPLLVASIIASFTALVVRYRTATPAEKDQTRWFVVAGGLVVLSMAIPASSPVGLIGNLLVILAIPLFPVSVGVAVLRSRLDGVSVALRPSLVYSWLVAGGLVVYAAVVLLLDVLLRRHAQPLVALVGAGAVAVAYQPLRLRLQRSTDRMLYGDRADPYAVSTKVGRRSQAAASSQQALSATVGAIADALRLPYVAIALPGDSPRRPTASTGTAPSSPAWSVPLKHGGDEIGQLLVSQRNELESLTEAEKRLLTDLSRQVAVVTQAALLDQALQRSLERQVLTREEERLRLRRDLHDGLGPTLAGVALGLDAARNMLTSDAESADDLLRDLKSETLGCVTEIRRIVDDLRPPTLDQLGLLAALRSFADRLSSRDGALQVEVHAADPLPALPAAVEVAAFRIATEAMTNVARHAAARHCGLRLDITDDLRIEIWDDGTGIPVKHRRGVGIDSMTERAAEIGGDCVVASAAEGGTVVVAHLPLVAA